MPTFFNPNDDNLDRSKETVEDLQYKNLKIIQNKSCFCFGTDAILLSDFITLKNGDKALDLCTGTGIVPLLLSGREKASKIVGIELMPYMANMAKRSVELNGLSGRVSIIEGDIREAHRLTKEVFDVVSVNPPYEKANSQLVSENTYLAAARHEIFCSLADIMKTANLMLKCGGRFFMIHRVARLAEIFRTMQAHKIEPKRLRFVHPAPETEPVMVLILGTKDGNEGIRVSPPLFIRNSEGEYTQEIYKIYHMDIERGGE